MVDNQNSTGVVLERRLKTWQDKAFVFAFFPLFMIVGWMIATWPGALIGWFVAFQVRWLYPRWDFGLDLELVDRAIGNMQLSSYRMSSYCLDFGEKKRLYIYRDNRNHRNTVRIAVLINEDVWKDVPLGDKAFKEKAGIGILRPCFDKKRRFTALFPTSANIDRRKVLMTMLQHILSVSGLDISRACARVTYVTPETYRNLYAAEGNLRSVLIRHNIWAISHDRAGKLWIETLPRNAVNYSIRALTQMELKRYKHEGRTFLESLPDDCVRPQTGDKNKNKRHKRSA